MARALCATALSASSCVPHAEEISVHKAEAQSILNATLLLNEAIGKIDSIITAMSDENEKKDWVQKLGGLIGYIVNEVQEPIVREYPELNPYPTA